MYYNFGVKHWSSPVKYMPPLSYLKYDVPQWMNIKENTYET